MRSTRRRSMHLLARSLAAAPKTKRLFATSKVEPRAVAACRSVRRVTVADYKPCKRTSRIDEASCESSGPILEVPLLRCFLRPSLIALKAATFVLLAAATRTKPIAAATFAVPNAGAAPARQFKVILVSDSLHEESKIIASRTMRSLKGSRSVALPPVFDLPSPEHQQFGVGRQDLRHGGSM